MTGKMATDLGDLGFCLKVNQNVAAALHYVLSKSLRLRAKGEMRFANRSPEKMFMCLCIVQKQEGGEERPKADCGVGFVFVVRVSGSISGSDGAWLAPRKLLAHDAFPFSPVTPPLVPDPNRS